MNNPEDVFDAIRRMADIRSRASHSGCPDLKKLNAASDNLPADIVAHIAFCPMCRKELQVLNSGAPFSEKKYEPNWNRMIRRLRLAARWNLLTTRIRSVTGIPDALQLEAIPAMTRLAELDGPSTAITVFEVNLTAFPSLSTCGLEVSRFGVTDADGMTQLVLHGFRPDLTGSAARLGVARASSYLELCGYRKEGCEWDLQGIEQKLQAAFLREGPPTRRLQRLISNSAWIDGRITAEPNGAQLILTPPESLTGLLLRSDIWTMLLVSDSPMDSERTP